MEILRENEYDEAIEMRKKFRVVVNGKEYVVEVEEIGDSVEPRKVERVERKRETPVKREKREVEQVKGAVTAPMPGKVTKIKVKIGDRVKKGAVVAMLEAMKMENEILAPNDGVVKEIKVKEGANVNRGDIIMVIE